MSRILTRHPQPPTIPINQNGNRNERNRKQCQQRASPINPQILKHGRREDWKRTTERSSHEVVPCKNGSDDFGIRGALVGEQSIEEPGAADGEEHAADYGHDPVD